MINKHDEDHISTYIRQLCSRHDLLVFNFFFAHMCTRNYSIYPPNKSQINKFRKENAKKAIVTLSTAY